ncbi:putative protein kinase RLK-Pelle-DLSV family [Dioscorea sansibarensis]
MFPSELEPKTMRKLHLRPFFLLLTSTLFSLTIARDTLTPTDSLADGETLVSSGEKFELGFFNPPGSTNKYVGLWYKKVTVQTIVMVLNRQNPINSSTGVLAITNNGSLVISDENSSIIWSTPATSLANPVARLLDTGNLVVGEDASVSADNAAWQSFDYPTDTLLPGMKLGWNLRRGLNRNLTAWMSSSDPAIGPYTMAMDIQGDPQIFLWSGSTRTWRTGPWNGLRYSGIPEMQTYSMFTFTYVTNQDEIYYSFNIRDQSIISRLIVNQTGSAQRLVWLNQTSSWNLFWFAPKDQCDSVSPCGPNGVCDPNNSPICDCLQGFVAKSPTNWALRDGTDGCVRKTELDCRNRTDGFVTLAETKLPDTSSATVDMSLSLDDCKAKCLSNCSCTAYASANISGSGSGCITWSTGLTDLRLYTYAGQDLYVRLAAKDLGSTSNGSHNGRASTVAIVVPVALGTLIISLIGCCLWRRRRKRIRTVAGRGTASFGGLHNMDEHSRKEEVDLPLFDLATIVDATDDFSMENKLGEGGFGPVYRGKLADGKEIGVKRLAKTSVQGCDEFKNEVMLIAKLQHRNLVQLLGCCIQGEERMLVYEYMPNKSLDALLFDKSKAAMLDWQTRHSIIMGIARGILYLHQDSRFRIIHRDLKASNILLDKEMNPKISDFGMARIFGGDETEVNTRKVVGTYGYMSPEYAMDGIFSVKSDVFSFGVLVLEIISAKKNRGIYLSDPKLNLLGHAWSLWKDGNALELVDESLGFAFPMAEVLRCIKVGLLCVQERPEDRPTMSNVVLMLGSESATLPNPRQPGFVTARVPLEVDSSSSKQDSVSINEISVTMFQGR